MLVDLGYVSNLILRYILSVKLLVYILMLQLYILRERRILNM
jgi:hypothetical protein